MNQPLLTVLMPVYNGEKYLRESVESILQQTFRDFEFLIIDDGSTDETPQILAGYASADTRIRIITNTTNKRLIASLNLGLNEATGKYIARQDADDVAYPERLEKQVEALEADPELLVAGAGYDLIDSTGQRTGSIAAPVKDDEVNWLLFSNCAFGHGFVTYRREVVLDAGGYDPDFPHAEDYELWVRLAEKGTLKNLPDNLGAYRLHDDSVSHVWMDEQLCSVTRSCQKHMARFYSGSLSYETVLSMRHLLGCDGTHELTSGLDEVSVFIELWNQCGPRNLHYLALFIDGLLSALSSAKQNPAGLAERCAPLADLVFDAGRSRSSGERKYLSDLLVRMSGVLRVLDVQDVARVCRRMSLRLAPVNPLALKHAMRCALRA